MSPLCALLGRTTGIYLDGQDWVSSVIRKNGNQLIHEEIKENMYKREGRTKT
jgi:hypothetical protein